MYIDSKVSSTLFTLFIQLNQQKASLAPPLNASLTQLSNVAKNIGLELFYLESYEKAQWYLTFAATAGDVESQYAMATCQTRLDGELYRPSEETKKWLRLAAAQDYVPALMRLGDTESLAKADALARPAATGGDSRAMLNLYTLTEDITWLDKAVAAGDHQAEFTLAEAYRNNSSLIPNTVERIALMEVLYQKSADGGYPMAVYDRFISSRSTASITEKQHRIIQLAWMGQIDGLLEYGYALAGLPRNKVRASRTYGFEKDLSKAFAVLGFVLMKLPTALVMPDLERDAEDLLHQLDPEKFEASKAIQFELEAKIPRLFNFLTPMTVLGKSYR